MSSDVCLSEPVAVKDSVEERIEDLLGRMTLDEKIDMLSGEQHMNTRGNERLGIPKLWATDGPHGINCQNGTAFPPCASMASSWNTELIERVGVALAEETRGAGRHVILGPCVNIHRTPLGGRNFESFGEDPYLSGRMAVAYVKGVQSRGVGTSTKHFACNNQEWDRTTVSVEIDERALREIYLPAFQAAVMEGDTWTVMGSYNRIRGDYACANKHLLKDILKGEWGFKGVVVSDWGAVHGTEDSALAGLDLEMPGPGNYFREPLKEAVTAGRVSEAEIDDKVRRNLRLAFRCGLFDGNQPEGAVNTPEHQQLALEVARESIVLVKNDKGLLPLKPARLKKIAVIGPNAEEARLGGGGSSSMYPPYRVSPLGELRHRLGERVRHEKGCLLPSDFTTVGRVCLVPPEDTGKFNGLKAEYFNTPDLTGDPVLVRVDEEINFAWGGGSPDPLINSDWFSARWTGKIKPPKTGMYRFGARSDDGARVWIDGELVVDHWGDHGPETRAAEIPFVGGKEYDLRVEYHESTGDAMAQLGWVLPDDSILERAIAAAKESDVAIVFVGLTSDFEAEGWDRKDMQFPGPQEELIRAIAAANSNTVVVMVNGSPLPMEDWKGKVPAIVEAWYPGMEGGRAIADVLFGDVNPSGKLPMTFPKKLEDNPSYGNYPGSDGKVHYAESLMVGYRHYDTKKIEPALPFGHGLSYTTFEYTNLQIKKGNRVFDVSVDIKNTGERAGKEVVQLYVHDVVSSLPRPWKELKGFSKVALNPGEVKTVSIKLGKDAFSFYDPEKPGWVAEPGDFEILVGSSSRDIRLAGKLTL